jgi:hypothetical protein
MIVTLRKALGSLSVSSALARRPCEAGAGSSAAAAKPHDSDLAKGLSLIVFLRGVLKKTVM